MTLTTDILIVGGGSAGFGAAYRAIRDGRFHVTLVEKNPGLGGTSTYGGVNCWEPGVGGKGVHYQLAARLQAEDNGFVGVNVEEVTDQTPWGWSVRCQDPYEESLERSFRGRMEQRRFHFEPEAMSRAMLDLLQPAHNARLLFRSTVTEVETDGRTITAVTAQTPEGPCRIVPRLVLDCSGDIVIARAAGCAYSQGEDAHSLFDEPNAPDDPQRLINGMSLVFRVTPCDPEWVDTMPEEFTDVDLTQWYETLERTNRPLSCFNRYPNGDININMLPTMPGELWLDLPEAEAMHIAAARVYAYWNWVQTKKNFRGYRIKEIFPMAGIRESYRLVGRYVLKEQDLSNGYPAELGPEHTVAWSDHTADIHGRTNKTGGMTMFHPYGIPYECMLPREMDNLLVACRGASFSHIASSSIRLSRTMMALGEAAGEAAVQILATGCPTDGVDLKSLREKLEIV